MPSLKNDFFTLVSLTPLVMTFAACYQLAQSVLKIGFALARRWDRVSAQGAVRMAAALPGPWLALAGPFLSLLAQMGV